MYTYTEMTRQDDTKQPNDVKPPRPAPHIAYPDVPKHKALDHKVSNRYNLNDDNPTPRPTHKPQPKENQPWNTKPTIILYP